MNRTHRMRRVILAGIIAAAASTFVANPAHAATPTCNTAHGYPALGYEGQDVWGVVPVYRSGSNPPTARCNLVRGTHGEAVKALQHAINHCFDFNETLVEDGDFGGATQRLLKQAQSKVGTTPDGKYGPNTRDAFNAGARWPADRQTHEVCAEVSGLD